MAKKKVEKAVVKMWQDEVNEHLANLHPVEIIDGIIKPAIEQVIMDYYDALEYAKDNEEQLKLHQAMIREWKEVLKRVKSI